MRAVVRSPDKLPADLRAHESLEVVRGDFSDSSIIQGAMQGADFVVCTGGNAIASKEHKLMLGLTQDIVAGMRAHGVRRLVYQAGAFSPSPGTPNPLSVRFLRATVGRAMGITGMLADNDAVMEFLASEASDLDWTVTRPGLLKEGPSQGELRVAKSPRGTTHFVDLAAATLRLVQTSEQLHACPVFSY